MHRPLDAFTTEEEFALLAAQLRPRSNARTTRILIVHDELLFAEALTGALGIDERLEVVGHASNGAHALALAEQLRPDLILIGMDMPGDGIEVTLRVLRAAVAAPVVILSSATSPEDVELPCEAPAVGFVRTDSSIDDLFGTIYDVAAPVVELRPAALCP